MWKRWSITERATFIIAAATVVNLVVAILMWNTTSESVNITKRLVETTNRPSLVANLGWRRYDKRKQLRTMLTITNIGNVPAPGFAFEWHQYLNGFAVPSRVVPGTKPYTLTPNFPVEIDGLIAGDQYDGVMNGTITLESTIDIQYKGINDENFYYHRKDKYDHELRRFIIMKLEAN